MTKHACRLEGFPSFSSPTAPTLPPSFDSGTGTVAGGGPVAVPSICEPNIAACIIRCIASTDDGRPCAVEPSLDNVVVVSIITR